MSELLELVLEFVVDILGAWVDTWAGWRFFLPFFGSLVPGVLLWNCTKGVGPHLMGTILMLAGLVGGLLWEANSG
jgi:hypothetical protein